MNLLLAYFIYTKLMILYAELFSLHWPYAITEVKLGTIIDLFNIVVKNKQKPQCPTSVDNLFKVFTCSLKDGSQVKELRTHLLKLLLQINLIHMMYLPCKPIMMSFLPTSHHWRQTVTGRSTGRIRACGLVACSRHVPALTQTQTPNPFLSWWNLQWHRWETTAWNKVCCFTGCIRMPHRTSYWHHQSILRITLNITM